MLLLLLVISRFSAEVTQGRVSQELALVYREGQHDGEYLKLAWAGLPFGAEVVPTAGSSTWASLGNRDAESGSGTSATVV